MAIECRVPGVVLPLAKRARANRAQTVTPGPTEADGYLLEFPIVVPSGEALPVTNAVRPRCIRPAPTEAFLPPPGETAAPLPTIAGCTLCNRSVAVGIAGPCPYWEHPSNRGRPAR